MSMLAEPKKRQKISVNPNGNSWSTDTSKFGQKLLEKMGWQKGKGLGLKESGDTSHVKVKMNMDNRGLGCTKKEADNWIAHQDDFSCLLAQLNDEHSAAATGSSSAVGVDAGKPSEPAPSDSKGLLAKSKSSRKRVHYEKFTKGKDVSRYGGKSLDQIFGRRPASMLASSSNATALLSSNNSINVSETSEDDSNSRAEAAAHVDHDSTQGSNMVASSLNVADYFAQKMAARRLARASSSTISKRCQTSEETTGADGSFGCAADQEPVNGRVTAVTTVAAQDDETGGCCSANGIISDAEDDAHDDGQSEQRRKKKKEKKKRKKEKKRRRIAEAEGAVEEEEAEH